MSTPPNTYALVLLGRFPGKDKPVAQALGRAFGKDENWGLPIVGATPINLITGLSLGQAQAIKAALAEVEQAGSRIQIQPTADESCPTVQWPAEAKIYGRTIGSFSGGTMVAAAPASAMACPHCGKPILVRLLPASAGPSASQSAVAAAPAPVALPLPVPMPVASPVPAPAPVPTAVPAPRRTPARGIQVMTNEPPTPRRPSPPVPIPVPVPQAPRPIPVQPPAPVPPPPDGLEELVPIQDFAPGPVAPPQPLRMPPAPGKVLPEVPVVDAEPPMAAPAPAPAYHMPTQSDPRMGVPVDLEAFEAGLQMGPAPEAPEPSGPPPEHVVPPVKPGLRGRGAPAGPPPDPNALCSIFIGKSRDPKVHELVAEIQGTSVEEAADLCQKAVVSVVKDIPVSEAEGIKQKLLELKVNPRIAVKR